MGTTTLERPSFMATMGARRAENVRAAADVIAKTAGAQTVSDYFATYRGRVEQILPAGVSSDRLLATALDAIRRNPKLQDCTVASLFGAVLLCAKMGLEPNTHQGHVYLIPRSKRRPVVDPETGKTEWVDAWEVHVQLGYKGRIELAYRSPKVTLVKAVLVCDNDYVEIDEGTRQVLEHRIDPRKERGKIIGAYAIVALTTGKTLFEWMDRKEIERIRDENSDAYATALAIMNDTGRKKKERDKAADTPWISDEGQMMRKTVLNRIDSYVPSTPEMAIASAIEAADIDGVAQDLDAVIAGQDIERKAADGDDDAEGSSVAKTTSTAAADKATATDSGDKAAQISHDKTPPIDLGLNNDHPMAEMEREERRSSDATAAAAETAAAMKEVQTKPASTKASATKAPKAQASFDAGFGSAE
jgi:recombination protein RecT